MISTLLLISTLTAPAADPREASRDRAFELIAKLGDTSFKVRESASDELIQLGAAAVEALRKGLTHKDIEISERCRKLLPQALDFHLQEQIDKFLAKPDGPLPEDLPAVKRWMKATGPTKESRELYASIVKEHRRLLIDVETDDQATQKYQAFCTDIYNRFRVATAVARREISRSELVLFFFLGGDPNCRKGSTASGTIPYVQALQFLNNPQAIEMLTGSGASPAFQKIFLAWLEQERYMSLLRRGFQLAATANLKEAAPIAIKIASDKTTLATSRAYALLSAAKLFTPNDLKKIEPLMDDKTVVGRIAVNGDAASTEMRDIALGIAVQATGQKMSDYGFERFRDLAAPGLIVSYSYYAQTEKKREEAFQKWKDWLAKNTK